MDASGNKITSHYAPVKDIPIGHAMGVKINACDIKDYFNLDTIIECLEKFHGGEYVIGYDAKFVEKPHYHIHFFTKRETSTGAMKTFRSSVFKKKYPGLPTSFRYYPGKDVPTASPTWWLSYAIKETIVKVNNIVVTPEMEIERGTMLEIKKLKKVKSEALADKDKKKKDQKTEMFAWVVSKIALLMEENPKYTEYDAFIELICSYFMSVEKYGSMRLTFIRNYWIEYKVAHSPFYKWLPKDVANYVILNK